MKTRVWITWEDQRRNRAMSKALEAKLVELKKIDSIKNPIIKYGTGIYKTLVVLLKEKPDLAFGQNPSLILSLFLVIIKRFLGFKVIIDAHNAGLLPLEGRSRALLELSRLIQRYSSLTIVTNEALKVHVESNGGKAFVLPDPIPEFPKTKPLPLPNPFNLLFICSFAEDEPYEIVFEAARKLDPSIHIYVTGNYRKQIIDTESLPRNITMLGFIPERDFLNMLHSVGATIDLTTRENCLVCGAYESVAAEKPMILSNTRALKSYFFKGAIYTDHTVDGLVDALLRMRRDHAQLAYDAKKLKSIKQREWCLRKKEFIERIEGLMSN